MDNLENHRTHQGNTCGQGITWRTTELIRGTPAARLKDRRTHTHPILVKTLPLNHCYETPHQIPATLGHSVESISSLCLPLPGKPVKLVFRFLLTVMLTLNLDLCPLMQN